MGTVSVFDLEDVPGWLAAQPHCFDVVSSRQPGVLLLTYALVAECIGYSAISPIHTVSWSTQHRSLAHFKDALLSS